MLEQDVPTGKGMIVRFTRTQRGLFKFYCDKKLLFFKSHRDKGMEGLGTLEDPSRPLTCGLQTS
jgi:hypothetical protein